MRQLQEYNTKRNFRKTSEPQGIKSTSQFKDFMVHLHEARRLHYDLRLQWDGVLLSWAIPKGPSYDPNDKRLAVQTEDHPVEYKAFEGVIPEKMYGAGPSLIWDAGSWRPLDHDVKTSLKKGHLKFYLKGVRLRGIWNLVRIHSKGKKSQWLLIKHNDKYAIPQWSKKVNLETISKNKNLEWQTSVATGRSLFELDNDIYKENNELEKVKAPPQNSNPLLSEPLNLPKVKMPSTLHPQLATLSNAPPEDMEDWIVERKYDGYRILAIKGKRVKLQTRGGHNWSAKFPQIKEALQNLPLQNIILDGEVIVFDKKNDTKESFNALQNYLKENRHGRIEFRVFDILYLDSYLLMDQPQKIRRQILTSLFENIKSDVLLLSEELKWSPKFFDKLCQQEQEGVILKHKEAGYLQTRSNHWLKLKCRFRDDFVVVGWTDPQGSRQHLGSLLLAEDVHGELKYRGKVGSGFNEVHLKEIINKLKKLEIKECPLKDCDEMEGAHFIKPYYFAEIRFSQKIKNRRLRHPVFLGLREDNFYTDKKVKMNSQSLKTKKINIPNIKAKKFKTTISISNPDRIFYEDLKLTKLDLLRYYYLVLDEFKKMGFYRPLSFLRCPEGISKECFFQKHLNIEGDHPQEIKITTKSGTKSYSYFESFDDLAALIQLGTLEFHGWNCSIKDTNKPQFVVWDIDPGPGVEFGLVTQTAHLIRLILKEKGTDCFVRATGGKGLHVLALVEGMSWQDSKKYSLDIAKLLVEANSNLYVIKSSLKLRKNKIFIDYLRNAKSATSILNYSTRARSGAPVCVPLGWDEVHEDLDPRKFTMAEVINRVSNMKKDPWEAFYAKL